MVIATPSRTNDALASRELLKRRRARSGLLDFTRYTMPTFILNWHHRVTCDVLDRFARGELKRVMIFMPPRHTKSEFVSRRLPAKLLGDNPNLMVMSASYGADLARLMNRDVQRIIDSNEYRALYPETQLNSKNVRATAQGNYLRNSDLFEIVDYTGSYRSSGIGGGLTGQGFDYGIIDDPIKSRAEANSITFRKALWEWYQGVFYDRMNDQTGSILITMTRWHEDDLCGRLLKLAEDDPRADQWYVLRLPAIAEDPIDPRDPRQIGEALWKARFNEDAMEKKRIAVGTYEWNAKYQQRPKPIEGNRIKREWLANMVNSAPDDCVRVRYWDKAGTQDGGAFTAGVLLAKDNDSGRYYVEHVVRGQWSAYNREQIIKQTAEMDKAKYGYGAVTYYVEQEPGSGGKESAENTIRNLAGHDVHADRPTGDKDTRLAPFEAQAEAGNIIMVHGDWNHEYVEELVAIPNGSFRDQSDASAGAFNKLADDEPMDTSDAGWLFDVHGR